MVGDLVGIGIAFLFVGFGVMLVRGLRQMLRDNNGSDTGGLGGMMAEVDRVVRPSVEHVIKAKQQVVENKDDVGGE